MTKVHVHVATVGIYLSQGCSSVNSEHKNSAAEHLTACALIPLVNAIYKCAVILRTHKYMSDHTLTNKQALKQAVVL